MLKLARRPAMHRLEAWVGPSLSRKGSETQRRRRILDREQKCHIAERDVFQNLVHSHTKASRRPKGYVPIVTVTRGLSTKNPSRWGVKFVGRWFKIQRAQNLARFWWWCGGDILCVGGVSRQIGQLGWGQRAEARASKIGDRCICI
jgi:hypothetical protein